jgi:hypothetical protein
LLLFRDGIKTEEYVDDNGNDNVDASITYSPVFCQNDNFGWAVSTQKHKARISLVLCVGFLIKDANQI